MSEVTNYRITIREKNYDSTTTIYDAYYYKNITLKQAQDLAVLHFWELYHERRASNGGWIPSSDFILETINFSVKN